MKLLLISNFKLFLHFITIFSFFLRKLTPSSRRDVSPLHAAVLSGSSVIVRYVVTNCKFDARHGESRIGELLDFKGRTPLHYAVKNVSKTGRRMAVTLLKL